MKTIDDVVNYVKTVHDFNIHSITKMAMANTILVKKATPLGLCDTVVKALRTGCMEREWNMQVDKGGKVNSADFVYSGTSPGAIGNIQIKRDVSTGLYIVNYFQKDDKVVCLSDTLDTKTRSDFNLLRVKAEYYSLNKDVQEAVIGYVKRLEKEAVVEKKVQNSVSTTGIGLDD